MKKSAIFICLLFAFAPGIFSQVRQQHIRIVNPTNGLHVQQDGNVVEFSTSIPPAADTKPVVFVKDPNGRYWPYVGPDQSGNRWTMQDVQFGNENDPGRRFVVTVIIINNKLLDKGFLYHGKTVYIENNTPLSLGAYMFLFGRGDHSQDVTVIRNLN